MSYQLYSGLDVLPFLPDTKLRELADELSAYTFNDVTKLTADVRAQLVIFESSVSNSRQTKRDQVFDIMKNLRDQGQMRAVLSGTEIVATGSYQHYGKMLDGRDVYEICKGVIRPDHRGSGLYHHLWHTIFNDLRSRFPESPILGKSKHRIVKSNLQKSRYREITYTEKVGLLESSTRLDPDRLRAIEDYNRAFGVSYFLFDPLQFSAPEESSNAQLNGDECEK